MNKRPILVAFSNQKGGVGKSTVTAVLASYFNYVRGLKVAVVDCDYPQFSLEKLRGRDLKNLEKSEYHQRLFCRQFEDGSRKAYPIVTSTPEAAAEIPGKLEGDYDLIFFDLPGTVNSRGVFESVMNMDFIFTPIVKDRMDSRTSKELYVMYNAIVLRMGLKVFETVLPDLERFNKEMTPSSRQHFRCTLLPPSESLLKDSRLEAFAQEMERIIFPG
ncbi:ParA family protein [Phocaeicola plebeius]|uniref:ParA family protein n=1 Tax=Phocaeicola plebeius TaxID=310297 RepID=UPI000E4C8CFA|nr:ParA family protein [Phocaeicola plebeius]RHJ64220.1 ParA family protein [Phocaeicola plebeius]